MVYFIGRFGVLSKRANNGDLHRARINFRGYEESLVGTLHICILRLHAGSHKRNRHWAKHRQISQVRNHDFLLGLRHPTFLLLHGTP